MNSSYDYATSTSLLSSHILPVTPGFTGSTSTGANVTSSSGSAAPPASTSTYDSGARASSRPSIAASRTVFIASSSHAPSPTPSGSVVVSSTVSAGNPANAAIGSPEFIAGVAAGGVALLILVIVALLICCVMFCCSRKRGKSSAKVHSTKLVLLESPNSLEVEMGNKSTSGFSPSPAAQSSEPEAAVGEASPPTDNTTTTATVSSTPENIATADTTAAEAPAGGDGGGGGEGEKGGGEKGDGEKGKGEKGEGEKGEGEKGEGEKGEGETVDGGGGKGGGEEGEVGGGAGGSGQDTATEAQDNTGPAEAEGEAPVVKEYKAEVCVMEGQQATLRVEVTGVPQPSISWKCGDKTVEPDYAIEIARDGTLCLVSAELSHTGTYHFTARNASGCAEGKVELKVCEEEEGGGVVATGEESEKKADAKTQPVAVDKFGECVAGLHANNNVGYFRQYQSLPSEEDGRSISVFKMSSNFPKNRFRNIAVYDENRIVLEALPSEVAGEDGDDDYVNAYMGDYINASYVDGYSKPKEYIACQGPLPQTVVDFWRAVWQEGVGTIAMVTNLREGNHVKCHQYWPLSGSVQYGPFTVTLAEQQMFADYIIRHLHIALGSKSKKVLHLQFTSWPDHGVPEYAGPSLTYLRRVKAESKAAKGPTVFHCSAGVGRTGTLLAVDIALEQAGKEGVVDITHIVTRLRQQRMKMVQTHDQYGFIYDAVLESLICGETQIPAQNLPKAMQQLAATDDKHGKSGYEIQFGVLEQVSPKPSEVITVTAQTFPEKNRSMEFLPSELWRVQLLMEHPGYINATFANGYKQKRGYIIAQAPMESTCRDFWKMVTDRRCGVIIMLSQLTENDKEVCTQYWPSREDEGGEGGGSVTHGNVTITAGSVKHGTLTQRTFSVLHHSQPQQKVTQFQLSAWNEEGLCTDPRAILELIELVAATQRRTGNNPIIVHGVDMVSRCGLLCALTNAIECCKTEGTVDVFQAVKALRIQKPGSVCTVQQYQSIFTVLQQFLNSFSIYANFK